MKTEKKYVLLIRDVSVSEKMRTEKKKSVWMKIGRKIHIEMSKSPSPMQGLSKSLPNPIFRPFQETDLKRFCNGGLTKV